MKYFNNAPYVALLLVVAMPANASVVYTYAGNPFNVFFDDGGLDYSTFHNSASSLTVTIELANTLGASLSSQDVTPLSYSFSDGAKILTETSGAHYVDTTFRFDTDSSGGITGWDVSLLWSLDYLGPGEETYYMRTHTLSSIGPEDRSEESYCVDYDPMFGCNNHSTGSVYVNNPGAWSVSAVPLPASVWLFAPGLLGLAGAARRKKGDARAYFT